MRQTIVYLLVEVFGMVPILPDVNTEIIDNNNN